VSGFVFARNVLSLSVSGATCRLLGFVCAAYLARVLGTEGFGKISFALAIISYAGLLVSLGLPGIGMREVAKSPERVLTYSGNILTLRLIASFVSLGLLLILSHAGVRDTDMKPLLLWYGFSLIPVALLIDWAFLGIQKAQYVGAGDMIRSGLYLLLVLVWVRRGADLVRVPQAYLAACALTALFLLVSLRKVAGWPRLQADAALWGSLFARGWPFAVSAILAVANTNIGLVILGATRGAHETGLYGAGYRVVSLLMSFATFLLVPMFPIYVQNFEKKTNNLDALVSRAMWLMAMVAVPLAVGGTILSHRIVETLYGPEYADAAPALAVLLWVTGVFFLREVLGYGLTAWNLQLRYARILAVSAGLNLALCLLLIPRWGILAAAAAMLASELVNLALMSRAAGSVVRISPLRYVVRPVLASAAMGVALFPVRGWSLALSIPAGAACYLAVLVAVRGIRSGDLRWLRSRFVGRRAENGRLRWPR
jgi:O-antigen/teichoic acid export membrane protein